MSKKLQDLLHPLIPENLKRVKANLIYNEIEADYTWGDGRYFEVIEKYYW